MERLKGGGYDKKLTKEYTQFRLARKFSAHTLIYKKDGEVYFNKQLVTDGKTQIAEGDDFINVGYNFRNHLARMLSNLYPIQFKFRGKKVNSIEGVLQGIKYKDKRIQNLILKYQGLDAYHTMGANTLDFWGNTGVLYWQGKPMDRRSKEYQDFIDELYISAIQNPLYKKALLSTGEKYLMHYVGKEDENDTVLTRYEYECRLNTLRDFIKFKQTDFNLKIKKNHK